MAESVICITPCGQQANPETAKVPEISGFFSTITPPLDGVMHAT
jgi:hypothetical protein